MKPYYDLHVHTYLSKCCSEKELQIPSSILSLAEEMEINTIGFSDHIWENPDIAPSDWYLNQDKNHILKLVENLKNVSSKTKFLVGCEADTIAPGKFSITPKLAEELDFVLLSCNHFQMKRFVEQPASEKPRDIAEQMLKLFISGVSSGIATSIAHPFVPFTWIDKFDSVIESISDSEFFDAFGTAQKNKTAIEITTVFLPIRNNNTFSVETPIRFLSIAKQAGCKFTFGSDAHDPTVQKMLPKLTQIIKASGITKDDILTIPTTSKYFS